MLAAFLPARNDVVLNEYPYLERDFYYSLSKDIPYCSRTREDISDQFLPTFFCSFMKVIKSGVETCFLFYSQSIEDSLLISDIPLLSFSAISQA